MNHLNGLMYGLNHPQYLMFKGQSAKHWCCLLNNWIALSAKRFFEGNSRGIPYSGKYINIREKTKQLYKETSKKKRKEEKELHKRRTRKRPGVSEIQTF